MYYKNVISCGLSLDQGIRNLKEILCVYLILWAKDSSPILNIYLKKQSSEM